jgi:hypothetical protein
MDPNTVTSPEVPAEFKTMVYSALNSAFEDVSGKVSADTRKYEAGIEMQNNKGSQSSGVVPVQTGVQNLLITLLIELARKLGLKEDELELVFEEVLKLVNTYKNKKAEA